MFWEYYRIDHDVIEIYKRMHNACTIKATQAFIQLGSEIHESSTSFYRTHVIHNVNLIKETKAIFAVCVRVLLLCDVEVGWR